jgi:hypothetical protein
VNWPTAVRVRQLAADQGAVAFFRGDGAAAAAYYAAALGHVTTLGLATDNPGFATALGAAGGAVVSRSPLHVHFLQRIAHQRQRPAGE